jgi:hypothetical protein
VALSILSLNVSAGILAEMPNNGGGKIVLLDTPCNIKDTWTAYSYLSNGQSFLGCWTAAGDRVFIDWGKNEIRSYPANAFSTGNSRPPRNAL